MTERTPPARGTKVTFKGKTYDFGYVGKQGDWILYEEGCCNMQDAFAVDPALVEVPESEPGSPS